MRTILGVIGSPRRMGNCELDVRRDGDRLLRRHRGAETGPPRLTWRGSEAMKAHGEWLIGMKEKYRRDRESLKALARDRAGGEFI